MSLTLQSILGMFSHMFLGSVNNVMTIYKRNYIITSILYKRADTMGDNLLPNPLNELDRGPSQNR